MNDDVYGMQPHPNLFGIVVDGGTVLGDSFEELVRIFGGGGDGAGGGVSNGRFDDRFKESLTVVVG